MSCTTLRKLSLCALPFLLFGTVSCLQAQTPIAASYSIGPTAEDFEPIPEGGDIGFGTAVALSGRTAMAGMPALDPGRVGIYVLRGDVFERTATLHGSDPNDQHFGKSIDLDGPIAVIGSDSAAYVFQKHGRIWKQTARLALGSPLRELRVVEHERGVIAIGAGEVNEEGVTLPGLVILYGQEKASWRRLATLRARDVQSPGFGMSLAMEGRTLVIGSPGAGAYIFVRDGRKWIQRQKLVGDNAALEGAFGASVAIRDRRIVVGAPALDLQPGNLPPELGEEGDAYVFLPYAGRWYESQRVNGDPTIFGKRFASSIAMGRNWVAFGAPIQEFVGHSPGGAVILFDWVGLHLTLGRSVIDNSPRAGVDLDSSGRRLMVGILGLGFPEAPFDIGGATIFEFGTTVPGVSDPETDSESESDPKLD